MSKTKDNTIGGVYCGLSIAPGLFAEKEGAGRYLVREQTGPGSTRRLGLVLGGRGPGGVGRYLALAMSGESCGTSDSLNRAAALLQSRITAPGFTTHKVLPPVPAMSARSA